jgi:hypothetical protein
MSPPPSTSKLIIVCVVGVFIAFVIGFYCGKLS